MPKPIDLGQAQRHVVAARKAATAAQCEAIAASANAATARDELKRAEQALADATASFLRSGDA